MSLESPLGSSGSTLDGVKTSEKKNVNEYFIKNILKKILILTLYTKVIKITQSIPHPIIIDSHTEEPY